MQDLYNLVTVEDLHKDEASIIAVLTSIREKRVAGDLKLLNYFKEVPISFGTEIRSIDRDVVEVSVHQLQGASLMHHKMTFIKCAKLRYDVIAKVLRVGKELDTALLTQFSYVQILAERRRHVRVKVSESSMATFRSEQETLTGPLTDISIGGVGILGTEPSEITADSRGVLLLNLRGARMEVPAKFLRTADEEKDKRHIIEMQPDSKSEGLISRFVFHVQTEIIRELKELYE